MRGPLYDCISLKLEDCEKQHKRMSLEIVSCVIGSYETYLGGRDIIEMDPVWRVSLENYPVWRKARDGIDHCHHIHHTSFGVSSCLLAWYKKHIKIY